MVFGKQTMIASEQLQDARRKADEDRHDSVTPMLWVTVGPSTGSAAQLEGSLTLHADGNGVLFGLSPTIVIEDSIEADRLNFYVATGPYGPLQAGKVVLIAIRWFVPAHPVAATLEMEFDNIYNRRYRWRQQVRILPERNIDLVGPPHREIVIVNLEQDSNPLIRKVARLYRSAAEAEYALPDAPNQKQRQRLEARMERDRTKADRLGKDLPEKTRKRLIAYYMQVK